MKTILPTIPENSATMPVSNVIAEQWKGIARSGAASSEMAAKSEKDVEQESTMFEDQKARNGKIGTSSVEETEHSEEVIDSLKKRNVDLEKQKEQLKKEWELLRTQLDPTNDDVMSIFQSHGERHIDERHQAADSSSSALSERDEAPLNKDDGSSVNKSESHKGLDEENDVELEAVLRQISSSSPTLSNTSTVKNEPASWEDSLTDSALKSQLHDGRSEVGSSRKELHDAKKRVMEMEYLLSIHRSDLASARGQVGVLQAENGELRGTNSQFKDALQHYAEKQQRSVDCLKNQLSDSGVREGLLRKEVQIAKEEAEIAKSNFAKAEERSKEMGELVEAHQKDFLEATVRVATLEAQNGELREVNRVQGEMNSLLSQMRDAMQGKVDEQQKALVTFENQLKESWAREGSLSADLAMASAEAASAKKDLRSSDRRVRDCEKSLKEATITAEKSNKSLQKANSRIKGLEDEVSLLRVKLSNLEDMEKKFLSDKEACSFMSFFNPESNSRGIVAPDLTAFCDYLMDNTERTLQQAPGVECKPSSNCGTHAECS